MKLSDDILENAGKKSYMPSSEGTLFERKEMYIAKISLIFKIGIEMPD